ncbi:DUF488 domain-containing protein [Brachybacterium aquaticum]|uniref:Uncharacterized protein YeaO (DUF488 family) n=1 Tax=Brachybacterium aquaticum TaxID=1432564 RepID=A0A841AA18_9MICO|nr:DUF488 family protein [Brachybacterium aquaticum]MBB5830803.1 uncharacterized protein YeaO (DUF488 family) [Brachybacterium aquaticum]
MIAPTLTLARVHDVVDDDGPADGEIRVLVDRLWPRGVKKERLAHDEWDKDVAPSTELRKAFHGGELDFEEFSARYRRELEDGDAAQALLDRAAEAGAERIVLLYAAKDTAQNHAQVLRDVLAELAGA